ncbi:MAG: sigma-70 family RNA polymerase sigma factor [Oscillospiraceae bacterium]
MNAVIADIAEKEVQSEDMTELFRVYKETGDIEVRNRLVLYYMDIVRYAAISTRNMYQKYADTEDIVNEATIALMNAVDSFDIGKNIKFETYASIRVRGAVIDYIRRQDIIPRNVRRFAREYDKAYSALYAQLDREPTAAELSRHMGLSEEKLESFAARSAAAQTLSFEELVFEGGYDIPDSEKNSDGWQPEQRLLNGEMHGMLVKAVDSLGERERLVISLYYYEKLKYSEIAAVIGVSESRVCQIHSAAVSKMRRNLEGYMK